MTSARAVAARRPLLPLCLVMYWRMASLYAYIGVLGRHAPVPDDAPDYPATPSTARARTLARQRGLSA